MFFLSKIVIALLYNFFARHETSVHRSSDVNGGIANIVQTAQPKESDYIYNYHCAKLTFGLLLFEFEDAVKEGDGARLTNVYKLALLFYKAYGHHKYAYVILLYLVKINATLTEQQSHSFTWNRFYNKYGGKGKNISLDLRMEQLNKLLKSQLRSLGPNINETNAARVANAVEGVELILASIDKDCMVAKRKGHRSKGKDTTTVKQIVKDLMDKRAFMRFQERDGYPSFPSFPLNLLYNLGYKDLHSWMTELMQKWTVLTE